MPEKTLTKSKEEDVETSEETTYFCKVVGVLLHMMIWSRSMIYSYVQDLSLQLSAVTEEHIYVMHRVMACCVTPPLQGWKLKPRREWDGK